MLNLPILSLVTFLPLAGATILFLLIRGDDEDAQRNAKYSALWTSAATFALSLFIWGGFDNSTASFQFEEHVPWMPENNISYHMGVDGISMLFVMLTTLLTPICILASWEVTKRIKEYMIAFLVLETMMLGMFSAMDMFVFYIFFEAVLIPMFLIIGIWGGPRRVYASFKFFLYTLLGSVLMLLAMLAMVPCNLQTVPRDLAPQVPSNPSQKIVVERSICHPLSKDSRHPLHHQILLHANRRDAAMPTKSADPSAMAITPYRLQRPCHHPTPLGLHSQEARRMLGSARDHVTVSQPMMPARCGRATLGLRLSPRRKSLKKLHVPVVMLQPKWDLGKPQH